MQPWTVIQHVEWEGPGLIARVGEARGLRFEARRMDLKEKLPSIDEVGGLVVMGGPMAVYDAGTTHPYLADEMRLIRDARSRNLPVLGVCLGSQLLAGAMGARVFKGPASEIGFGEIQLTEEGARDPVLGPVGPTAPVFHWHGDTFDLPAGAVHLAWSDRYPHQAFRVGDRCYAFQFHVEMDRELARQCAPHLPPGMAIDEAGRQKIEEGGTALIGRFFDAALAR